MTTSFATLLISVAAANIGRTSPPCASLSIQKPARRVPRILMLLTLLALSSPSAFAQYQWTNFAGTQGGGSADGTGSAARFFIPQGVAVDGNGTVYVADTSNHTIRKVTAGGVVSTLAGSAGIGGSNDGTGSTARFSSPTSVAVDSNGNVYVADTSNHTIRKVTSGGVVTTLAGLAGNFGSSDGPGSAARFNSPFGVAVDTGGNIYVADSENHTIRKVSSTGLVSTLVGLAGSSGSADGTGSDARFDLPKGVAVDSSDNVYVADALNNTIRKVTSGGVVSTLAGLAGSSGSSGGTGSAARFQMPTGVAVDGNGNVYVADALNNIIRRITPAGVVSNQITASLYYPTSVAVDINGNLYVADSLNNTIRKLASGFLSTFAGLASSAGNTDGTGSAAHFHTPYGVTVDGSGNVYVADTGNYAIRKVTPAGVVTTLAGMTGSAGSTDGTGSAAKFNLPKAVATDSSGNVYVADTSNHTIRKVTPAGVVSTLVGVAGSSGSSDGGFAARFYYPAGVAVDGNGNVYVADTYNHTIRKVTPGGLVSTLAGLAGSNGSADGTGSAARFYYPQGIAVDINRNIYVADSSNHIIRKVTPDGEVSTLAGSAGIGGSNDGTGSTARFSSPTSVAVDASRNIYVADANHTLRKVTSAGVVSTLAGRAGIFGCSDGIGSAAKFYEPRGIAVTSSGDVFVADTNNNRISTGTVAYDITIQLPDGSNISPGGAHSWTVLQGGIMSFTFTINNPGAGDLNGLTITKDGANADDFIVTTGPTASVNPGGSTTFIVQFSPAAGGAQTFSETATLHIANNVVGKSPFDIYLTGMVLSYTHSTGNDGMSDAAKFLLAPMGFNWQVSQPALVNTYYTNANAANLYTRTQYDANRTTGQNDVTAAPNTYGLYTLSQVQTLNASTPLLTKNSATGQFKLTIGVQQTTNLTQPFTAFPLSAPNTSINTEGQMEFLFTVPGNAAFFRVQAK